MIALSRKQAFANWILCSVVNCGVTERKSKVLLPLYTQIPHNRFHHRRRTIGQFSLQKQYNGHSGGDLRKLLPSAQTYSKVFHGRKSQILPSQKLLPHRGNIHHENLQQDHQQPRQQENLLHSCRTEEAPVGRDRFEVHFQEAVGVIHGKNEPGDDDADKGEMIMQANKQIIL